MISKNSVATTEFYFLFPLLILISCSTSEQTVRNEVSDSSPDFGPDSTIVEEDNRILPYPTDILPTYQQAVQNGTRTEGGAPTDNYWQQYTKYDMDVEVVPADTMLHGNGTITYFNNSPDTLSTIYMELAQNLHKAGVVRNEASEVTGGVQIHNIVLDGDTLQSGVRQGPRYFVDGTRLLAANGTNLHPGDSTEINIEWSFKIPQQGASGRMGYSKGNLFHIAYWYPFVSVYDDVNGWFTESFMGQTEFYMGYADYNVSITMPDDWLIHATGVQLNEQEILQTQIINRVEQARQSDTTVTVVAEDDFGSVTKPSKNGTHTWHFSANKVRDFTFSATKEFIWEAQRTPVGDLDNDGNTDYTQINALYRSSAPLWTEVADYSAHSIAFLSDYTGIPYPWPHMTAVEGDGIIGGGMEFPMMTIMGSYNSRGASALYNVTAHELAHMWVPMIVGTNERRYSWMDEGTTTFNEGQARADRFPDTNPEIGDQNSYLRIANTGFEGPIMRWSNYHYFSFAYSIASYPKPASVLVALRGILGEDIFNEALQTYLERWKYKHPYPWDMFHTFEDVSGRDLEWFWRSWYYENWVLDQKINNADIASDNTITVTISDNGEIPMPVDLTFVTDNGKEITRRIPVNIWLDGAKKITRKFTINESVEEIIIDKNRHYPDVNRNNNVWSFK